MNAKNTPTPWRECPKSLPAHRFIIDQDRRVIADVGHSNGAIGGDTVLANAAFIVRAANAHDDLVKACEAACDAIAILATGRCSADLVREQITVLNNARAALAKARGE